MWLKSYGLATPDIYIYINTKWQHVSCLNAFFKSIWSEHDYIYAILGIIASNDHHLYIVKLPMV